MTLRSRLRGWITAPARRRAPPEVAPEIRLEQHYWLLLGRATDPVGRETFLPQLRAGAEADVIRAILDSQEFHARFVAGAPPDTPAQQAALDDALAHMSSDEAFVDLIHHVILGRSPSRQERDGCLRSLRSGVARAATVQALLQSDEFRSRYSGPIPEDQQLCELANPAKWDNAEWMELLRSLQVARAEKTAMHRKAYEYTQTLFGLRRLGVIHADAVVLGVGAGHEPILYWLANHVRRVVATDLYGPTWQSAPGAEGDERMLRQPELFAPVPYPRERLTALRMDGRHLAFADASFDAVHSLSSIEHFGGWPAAKRAVDEMGRVLKPGGVLALATEWRLHGPPCDEVFAPQEVRALIDAPGLMLVEPIDDRVWDRYRAEVVDLAAARTRTPHMLVRWRDTVFTSVMLFLRKAA